MKYTRIEPHMLFYAYRKSKGFDQEQAASFLECTLREYQLFERYGVSRNQEFASSAAKEAKTFEPDNRDLLRIWMKYFNKNVKEAAEKVDASITRLAAIVKGYNPKNTEGIFNRIKKDLI